MPKLSRVAKAWGKLAKYEPDEVDDEVEEILLEATLCHVVHKRPCLWSGRTSGNSQWTYFQDFRQALTEYVEEAHKPRVTETFYRAASGVFKTSRLMWKKFEHPFDDKAYLCKCYPSARSMYYDFLAYMTERASSDVERRVWEGEIKRGW